jgi:cystathionine beta-synthase
LAREEGLLAGPSAGTALAAALRVAAGLDDRHLVVVLLPDSGRSYLSKNLDAGWLARWGFGNDTDAPIATVAEFYSVPPAGQQGNLVTVKAGDTIGEALDGLARLTDLDPQQRIPVVLDRRAGVTLAAGDVVGSTSIAELQREAGDALLADHQGPALPTVGLAEPIAEALRRFSEADQSALVLRDGRVVGCISRAELERGSPQSTEIESLTARA